MQEAGRKQAVNISCFFTAGRPPAAIYAEVNQLGDKKPKLLNLLSSWGYRVLGDWRYVDRQSNLLFVHSPKEPLTWSNLTTAYRRTSHRGECRPPISEAEKALQARAGKWGG